jgi:excisionase family DNA binding protein
MHCTRAGAVCHTHPADLMNLTTQPWLTANEAASYLRVKPATLLMWARQGKVQGRILSGTHRHVWRFQTADLDAMLALPSVALESRRIQ